MADILDTVKFPSLPFVFISLYMRLSQVDFVDSSKSSNASICTSGTMLPFLKDPKLMATITKNSPMPDVVDTKTV